MAASRTVSAQLGWTEGKTLLLGMNPGPWGMAQSGVPFGSTEIAKNQLQIKHTNLLPEKCSPKTTYRWTRFNTSRNLWSTIMVIMFDHYGDGSRYSPTSLWSITFHCYCWVRVVKILTPDNLPTSVMKLSSMLVNTYSR